jgi:type IV secretory pathway VirB10-like protein
MEISKGAIGLIVAAGVTAGAVGAYVTKPAPPAMAAVQTDLSPGMAAGDASVTRPDSVPSEVVPSEVASEVASRVRSAPAAPAAVPEAAPRTPARAPRAVRESTASHEPAPQNAAAAPAAPEVPPPAPEPVVFAVSEAPAPEPSGPELIELVVSADSVIGIQLDSSITSERARVEDAVDARVVRDVRVGDRVAIPAGSRMRGEVTLVERGGRLKERARLGVRFTSIALPSGAQIPIQTETVYREGDSQASSSSAKIGGGAIGGAIIGGILGGAKGAAIGGSVGAGAGSAAVLAGDRNQATLASGSPLTIRVEQPIVLTVEK